MHLGFTTMICPKCLGQIEFPSVQMGAQAACPHCGASVKLVIPKQVQSQPTAAANQMPLAATASAPQSHPSSQAARANPQSLSAGLVIAGVLFLVSLFFLFPTDSEKFLEESLGRGRELLSFSPNDSTYKRLQQANTDELTGRVKSRQLTMFGLWGASAFFLLWTIARKSSP